MPTGLFEVGFLILQSEVGFEQEMLPRIRVFKIRSWVHEFSHPVHHDHMISEFGAIFLDGRAG